MLCDVSERRTFPEATSVKKRENLGGEMAQSVKCLSGKHRDLSSIPGNHVKMLCVVVCICNPRRGGGGWEVETRGCLGLTFQAVYPNW